MIRDRVYRQLSVNVDGNVLNIDEVKSINYFICTAKIGLLLLWSLFLSFFFALVALLRTVVFLLTLLMFNYA